MVARTIWPNSGSGRSRATALRPRLGILKRFRRDEDGSTAVEFAFVSVPFFALLFAIIETALAFWAGSVLETAVADASRTIYTGQFQQTANGLTDEESLDAFRDEVCSRVVALFDCAGGLRVDIRAFARFQDVVVPGAIDDDGAFDEDAFGFQDSGEREVVIVRAAIEYPVFVNLLGGEGGLANGRRLIMATAAFQNEPFGQP